MLPVLGYPWLLRGCDTGPRASTWRKETRRAHPEPSPGARATADGGSQCPPQTGRFSLICVGPAQESRMTMRCAEISLPGSGDRWGEQGAGTGKT